LWGPALGSPSAGLPLFGGRAAAVVGRKTDTAVTATLAERPPD
jgi:hypothetical protein